MFTLDSRFRKDGEYCSTLAGDVSFRSRNKVTFVQEIPVSLNASVFFPYGLRTVFKKQFLVKLKEGANPDRSSLPAKR